MADDLKLSIVTEPLHQALKDMDRRVHRAQMYAVREAARTLRREAARRAPVYQGDRRDIPKGRLKRSIRSDRRLSFRGRDTVSVKVAPRGWPVKAYAGKAEARQPYMAPAHEVASAQLQVIAMKAYAKAMRRR